MKYLIDLTLLLLALLLPATAAAYDFEAGGIFYNITSDTTVMVTYETTNYNSYSGDVIIPETVTLDGVTYIVTAIGENAFYECSALTSIVISDSVQSLGKNAFVNCTGLRNVTIGKSITTLSYRYHNRSYPCFSGCDNITSLTWNAVNCSISGMGTSSLDGRANLEHLTIGPEVQTIPENFVQGSKITEVTIPSSVTSIGYHAFNNCNYISSLTWNAVNCASNGNMSTANIEQVTIGPEVQIIPENVVNGSKITEVFIPNSVTLIGSSAFNGCERLNRVNISSLEAWCSIQFDSNPLYNAHHLFLNNQEIQDLVIPNSVSNINACTFVNCESLRRVTIPNTVTTIGAEAFMGCINLNSVNIPNSVRYINNEAFYGCMSLTDITIPGSVEKVGVWAFIHCYNLAHITVADDNTVYDSREGCNAIIETATNTLIAGCQNTIIPRSVTSIAGSAFYGCMNLMSIVIPNTVTQISFELDDNGGVCVGNPFGACGGLTSIIVEDGNPVYDSRDNCNAIIETATNTLVAGCKNTVIPNSVIGIGDYAYESCYSLTSIDIPNSVSTIGYDAFMGCTGLTSIDLPNSVTTIKDGAFFYCTGLKSISIPNSVTSIGAQAFCYCTGLTDVYCYTMDPSGISMGHYAFYLVSKDYSGRTLHVPSGAASVYLSNRSWYPYFETIVEMEPIPALSGDVDGDGRVSIADLTCLIDMLLTGATNVTDYPGADVDGDGRITIADVTDLIDILLTN